MDRRSLFETAATLGLGALAYVPSELRQFRFRKLFAQYWKTGDHDGAHEPRMDVRIAMNNR